MKPHPVAVVPRLAATTLVLRDGTDAAGHNQLQVLMVQRSAQASFMPGAYVFPGGAVDEHDSSPACAALCDETAARLEQRVGGPTQVGAAALAYAVAGLRECFEECGLWLGAKLGQRNATQWLALRKRALAGEHLSALAATNPGEQVLSLATSALQAWSHWVTPVGLPKRFDTLFFVAQAPQGMQARPDEGETARLAWVGPEQALTEHAAGRFPMEFATVSTVNSLLPFVRKPVAQVLAHAAQVTELPALHPRLKLDARGEVAGVLLPGQEGYGQGWQGQ